MKDRTENELKPCPFCGGQAKIEQSGKKRLTIKCQQCFTQRTQQVLYQTLEWLEKVVTEEWNTRSDR